MAPKRPLTSVASSSAPSSTSPSSSSSPHPSLPPEEPSSSPQQQLRRGKRRRIAKRQYPAYTSITPSSPASASAAASSLSPSSRQQPPSPKRSPSPAATGTDRAASVARYHRSPSTSPLSSAPSDPEVDESGIKSEKERAANSDSSARIPDPRMWPLMANRLLPPRKQHRMRDLNARKIICTIKLDRRKLATSVKNEQQQPADE